MNRHDYGVLERFFKRRKPTADYQIKTRWGTIEADVNASSPDFTMSRILKGQEGDLWELAARERAHWAKYDPSRLGLSMFALPELIANSPVPGTLTPLGTLSGSITSLQTTITASAPAPTWLQAPGQFRIVIDNEIMLVTAGASSTTWTVTRGGALAAPDNCTSAAHANNASVYHYLTAGALVNIGTQNAFPAATVTVAASNAPLTQQTASGFICSGTADQTVLNNAVAAIPTAGGLLLASEGTYNLTGSVTMQRDYSGFLGMNRGSAIFSMSAGFSGAQMLAFNRNDLVGTNLRPASNITVGNFTVIGNQVGTQSTTNGIAFSAFRSTLRDFEVYQVNSVGVDLLGVTAARSGNANDWTTYGTWIQDGKIHENGNGGIWWDAASTDSSVRTCEIYQNAGPGILCSGSSISQIEACYIWQNFDQSVAGGSALGNGIQFNGGSRTNLVGNKIEQNRGGINMIAGSGYQIIGNVFASNSTAATTSSSSPTIPAGWILGGANNVRSDIQFTGAGGAPSDVLIVGNSILPQVYGTDSSAYAIQVASGTKIIVRHNDLEAGLTGIINNSLGGGNIWSCGGNVGYVTEASGQATITAAATSVTVTHGLAYTPLAQDINVTLVVTGTVPAALGNVWISAIGSTTFQINVSNVPGANTAIFGWAVQTHRFS